MTKYDFIQLSPDAGERWENISEMIVSRNGVTIVPRTREDEVVRLLQALVDRAHEAKPAPRAEVAKRKLLRPDEVAEVLGCSLAHAYALIDSSMTHVAVGERGKRVPLKALDDFINRRTEEPAWEAGSTRKSRGARGTAGTTTPSASSDPSASRRKTSEPRSSRSDASNAKPMLRPVFPRTRPRDR
ncbi:MAG: helix-turn-helix domain-containing protein [Sandaracinus sp.]